MKPTDRTCGTCEGTAAKYQGDIGGREFIQGFRWCKFRRCMVLETVRDECWTPRQEGEDDHEYQN